MGVQRERLPVRGTNTPMLQNLGPGTVYMGGPDVTVDDGVLLPVDATYEFPRDLGAGGGALWLVADQPDTEIRYMVLG